MKKKHVQDIPATLYSMAMATDGTLNQTMLLEIIACLLVAGDSNVRSNKCLGYMY